jgi:lysozyme
VRRRLRRAALIGGVAVSALALLTVLVATGVVWPNRWFAASYPVRGVDVSSYQGQIDWPALAVEDIDFAYLKATEGSSDRDERFAENWAEARKTRLAVGAYHFFSFESRGESQAANIVATVPDDEGTLPIVVDVEFYGDFSRDRPPRETVRRNLDALVAKLRSHYGRPPILYATTESYDAYLRDAYPDEPIWIRSVLLPTSLSDGREWTMWQYSNRDRLNGYDGEEFYIDLNVLSASTSLADLLAQ